MDLRYLNLLGGLQIYVVLDQINVSIFTCVFDSCAVQGLFLQGDVHILKVTQYLKDIV